MGTFNEETKTWEGDPQPEAIREWDEPTGTWKTVGHTEPKVEAKPAAKKATKKKAKKKTT